MPDRDLRACFVGDSFVAGLGDSSGLGWVGRVSVAALARGVNLTSYNLGVRRDTSVQVGERIGREVGSRLHPATDPRVILSFGVNDTTLENGRPRVGTNESVTALQRSQLAVRPAGVLLVGPPAVDDDAQNERIEALNQAFRAHARDFGLAFVDSFDGTVADSIWRQQVRDGDGFHPDSLGYQRLANLVCEPVLDWLMAPAPLLRDPRVGPTRL